MVRFLRRPPSWRILALRLVHLNAGLMLFGVSLSLMIRAAVGLGPWDVLHQGLALRTPLSIGQVMVLAGLALLLFSVAVAKVRPGVGTVLNMALVGPWVDAFLAIPGFPGAVRPLDGAALFALGLLLNGAATGLYLTAGFGAGPRDGFAIGLSRLAGVPVRRARTIVELAVCSSGWLLGGSVGVGTVAFALAIGPLMQASLRLFGGLERRYRTANMAAETRRGALTDGAVSRPRSSRPGVRREGPSPGR